MTILICTIVDVVGPILNEQGHLNHRNLDLNFVKQGKLGFQELEIVGIVEIADAAHSRRIPRGTNTTWYQYHVAPIPRGTNTTFLSRGLLRLSLVEIESITIMITSEQSERSSY